MERKDALYRQALAGLLVCLAFFFLLHHTLAGGTLLADNLHDSYALQAQTGWKGGCTSQTARITPGWSWPSMRETTISPFRRCRRCSPCPGC